MLSGGRMSVFPIRPTLNLARLGLITETLLKSNDRGSFTPRFMAAATKVQSIVRASHGQDATILNVALRPMARDLKVAARVIASGSFSEKAINAILGDALGEIHQRAGLMRNSVLHELLRHEPAPLSQGARVLLFTQRFVAAYPRRSMIAASIAVLGVLFSPLLLDLFERK